MTNVETPKVSTSGGEVFSTASGLTFGNPNQPGGVAALEVPRPPLLHEALAAVARDVDAVGKTGRAPGEMGGFAFRKIDDVMNAIHPAMAEHGILIWYELLAEPVHHDWSAKMHRLTVPIAFTFQGPAGDVRTVKTWGEALDNGDKGIGKAVSYALKDVLCRLLTLPTLDPAQDNEAGPYEERTAPVESPPAPTTITDDEKKALRERIKQLDEARRAQLAERWINLTKQHALRPLDHLQPNELPVVETLFQNIEKQQPEPKQDELAPQIDTETEPETTEEKPETACAICGSKLAKLVEVNGVLRCARQSDCNRRAMAALDQPRVQTVDPGPALAVDAQATAKRFGCVHETCLAPDTCDDWNACAEKPA